MEILGAAEMEVTFFMACHSLGHSSSTYLNKSKCTKVQRQTQELLLDFMINMLR